MIALLLLASLAHARPITDVYQQGTRLQVARGKRFEVPGTKDLEHSQRLFFRYGTPRMNYLMPDRGDCVLVLQPSGAKRKLEFPRALPPISSVEPEPTQGLVRFHFPDSDPDFRELFCTGELGQVPSESAVAEALGGFFVPLREAQSASPRPESVAGERAKALPEGQPAARRVRVPSAIGPR